MDCRIVRSSYQAGVYDSVGSRDPFWHCVKLWLIHMQLRGLDNVLFGHRSELYALSAKQKFLSESKTNVISIWILWGATHDPEYQPQTELYRCAAYWPYEGTEYRVTSSTQAKTHIQGQHLGFMIWDLCVFCEVSFMILKTNLCNKIAYTFADYWTYEAGMVGY